MRKLLILKVAFLGAGLSVQAQEPPKTIQMNEMVVTGNRVATPIEKSGKAIFTLDSARLSKQAGRTVAEVLNEVPGVQMDGQFNTPGTNIGYFVRGAASKRTLILIDGIPYNDPSLIDQVYDLRLLDINQVESIEIVRGGLSALYGTGAAAAVINIRLKQSSKKRISGQAGLTLGSFGRVSPNVNVNGTSGDWSYQVQTALESVDGFSAALDDDPNLDFDNDGFQRFNALGRLNYQLDDSWKLGTFFAVDDFEAEFDAGALTDDPNALAETNQNRYGLTVDYNREGWSIKQQAGWALIDRKFESTAFSGPEYDARNFQYDGQATWFASSELTVIGGLNVQSLEYEQVDLPDSVSAIFDFSSWAPFAAIIFETGDFNFQVAGRINQHSDYGTAAVYNINPSYLFRFAGASLKAFGSYSTAYNTPSLFQLQDPNFGNVDLEPETSKNGELGVSWLGERFRSTLIYFQRTDADFIDFRILSFTPFEGEYFNAEGRSRLEGVEWDGNYRIGDALTLNANYTFLSQVSGGDLRFRVPKHKVNAALDYQGKNWNAGMSYTWTGARAQQDPLTFGRVPTDAFGLLNLYAGLRLNNLELKGAVNNLTDTDYEAILGFTSVGRNYQMAISYNF